MEQIVIPKGQPAELLPRSPEVLALQVKLVESYQLASEKIGSEANKRLRILPNPLIPSSSSSFNSNNRTIEQVPDEETFEVDEEFDSDVEDLGVSVAGGTSPGRLPILPE